MKHYFFHLESPLFLLLLIPLPLLYFIYHRSKHFIHIHFSSINIFSTVKEQSIRQKLYFIPPVLRLIAIALVIMALARPQLGNKTTEILSEGIDILLSIDTSGSMKAMDFTINNERANRLEVVKNVVDEFISNRTSDRIGLIVFGEQAYTQCPLTLDYDTLRSFLKWLHIGIVGDGTAIGNALATSVKRLKDQKAKSKIIILLTDGRNNAGEISPAMAAQIAKEYNIKIYTIGVGSDGPVPYPEETAFGTRLIRVRLDLDEQTLKDIAQTTGGRYFLATETEQLKEIYEAINQLEKTEVKIKEFREYKELYLWFVLASLILLIIEFILSRTIFLRIP